MRSGISSARGRAFHCLLALGRPITFRCGAKCHSLDSFWIKLTWGKTGAATGVLGREDTVSFSGAIDIQFTLVAEPLRVAVLQGKRIKHNW